MSVGEVVRKYFRAARDNRFIDFEKDFARRIESNLSDDYKQRLDEPTLVQHIEGVVNSVRDFQAESNPFFELSSKAIFIHGYRSQVEFERYGQPV